MYCKLRGILCSQLGSVTRRHNQKLPRTLNVRLCRLSTFEIESTQVQSQAKTKSVSLTVTVSLSLPSASVSCATPTNSFSPISVASIQGRNTMTSTRTYSSTSRVEEVNGANIHCEIVGSGPHPVLLMPGALGTAKTDFGPQMSGLSGELFTLVGWDPRGYGGSRPPDRSWPLRFFERDAEHAAELMRKLGYMQYSVLGWSDGGITAMVLASRYPAALRRLVVWGANAYIAREDVQLYEKVRDVSKWSERMRKPMEDTYGKEGFPKIWEEWIVAITRYYTELNGDIVKSGVSQIACPTFIMHGAKDPMVPGFHADFLRLNIKGNKYYEFPEGKHNFHFKYAEEFNKMVTEFLCEDSQKASL